MQRLLVVVLLVPRASPGLAGLALAGCSGGGEEEGRDQEVRGWRRRQGGPWHFIPKVTGNAFFESANKGAQDKSRVGFTVDYIGDAAASVSAQVSSSTRQLLTV